MALKHKNVEAFLASLMCQRIVTGRGRQNKAEPHKPKKGTDPRASVTMIFSHRILLMWSSSYY